MPKQLSSILNSLIAPESDWKILLLSQWQEIIGGLRTKIRLEKIVEDTLIIGVYDSHWMQEIYLLSNIILSKIVKIIGKDKIKKLRFKLIEEKKYTEIININNKDILEKTYKIDHKYKKALTSIHDAQLQILLEKYLIKCLQNKT